MRDMEDRAGNLVRAHTCTRTLTQNFRETHYVLLHQATFTGHLLHGLGAQNLSKLCVRYRQRKQMI